jgi:DNA mismatch repair protein MutS
MESPAVSEGTGPSLSPAMAQYMAQKQRHTDALLFFRMGDFYEVFFDDAKIAAKALGITLTSRNKGESAIPMAGVPVRAIDGYLQKLVQMGHKVAICEQMQDPREAKGVVERAVVRVVTPGTLTEDNLLNDRRSNHLAAVCLGRDKAGIAWVELSTGAFLVHECAIERLADELVRIEPAELLLPEDQRGEERVWLPANNVPISFRPGYDFGAESGARTLQQFFAVKTLAGFGVQDQPLATGAAGALISYLQETQLCALPHLRGIEVWHDGSYMRLDRATRQSLELVQTMRGDEGTPLLSILDRTCTPMGARTLRNWLLAPLSQVAAIQDRQDAIAELHAEPPLLSLVTGQLAHVLDLERLTSRAAFGRANGRDLIGLRQSLERLPAIRQRLATCRAPALLRLHAALDPLPDLCATIAATLVDEPPLALKEGGLIRAGFHAELDELRELARDSTEWMARYQQNLAERTGIPSLKVGFNRVFGYYIEVTHTHREIELPPEFQRKQTTKNAERYVTDELRTFETKILKAEENSRTLEYDLFTALRERVATDLARLQSTAHAVAEFDAYASLATVARDRNYCCPKIDDSQTLRIEDGRHPVIESTHAAGTFVANDTDLDPPQRRLVLLTGPNMAGKSTWIRQNALIAIMAQIGSFVPAKSAARRPRRPRVHARRRRRRHQPRRLDLHGRDDRDRQHPEQRDAAQPRHPRRSRPRHQHLRRLVAGVGDRRRPARTCALPRAVRDPLPSAHGPRRPRQGHRQFARRRARMGRRDRLPASHRAGRHRPQLRLARRPPRGHSEGRARPRNGRAAQARRGGFGSSRSACRCSRAAETRTQAEGPVRAAARPDRRRTEEARPRRRVAAASRRTATPMARTQQAQVAARPCLPIRGTQMYEGPR